MRKVYVCDPHCFDDHYVQKGGGFPVYIGAGGQRGHGIGGIFSNLAKMAIPLLKRAAKTAGRQILKSGAQFAGDLLEGKNFKTAAKQRALEAGKSLGRSALTSVRDFASGNVQSGGRIGRPRKRKATMTLTKLQAAKRRKILKSNTRDIFG